MFGLIKKMFVVVLSNIVNASNHIRYVSLSNQKCKIQPTLINLHPNEYSQEFHHYPFAVKLDRCAGSFNTINDLSNKACVPNKAEDLNLRVFNMITDTNEWKTLPKHISYECKCKFDETKCKSNQWRNNDKCRYECKKHHICEKEYVWNPVSFNCENVKYLAIIMDDLVITCDDVIESYNEEIKAIQQILMKKYNFAKHKLSIFYLSFY